MTASTKLRLSARFLVLDLIGTLLILVGALDLAGIQLLGPLSRSAAGHGWPLVILGAFSIALAAAFLVTQVLAKQRRSKTNLPPEASIRTVRRRAR